MSLRFRLWLVIGFLALLPLAVGAVVASVLIPDVQQTQSTRESLAASAAVRSQLQVSCRLAGVTARSLALDAAATSPRDALDRTVDGTTVQYAALIGDGRVVASAGTLPPALRNPAEAPQCSRGGAAGDLLTERVSVSGPLSGVTGAVVATAVDLGALRSSLTDEAKVALVRDGRTVASTDAAQAGEFAELARRAGSDGSATTGDLVGGVAAQGPGAPWDVVVAGERADASGIQRLVLLAGLLLAVAGLLTGWWIARSLTQPLDELGQVAERVAKGELDLRAPVRSVDEVGRLGTRFNDMTAKLRDTISELESNRDKMAESLSRMGATLKNTHDLGGLLKLVLDTAVDVSGAHHGVALVLDGPTFKLAAQNGIANTELVPPRRVVPGTGVLGSVVTAGGFVRGRIGTGPGELRPSPDEPGSGHLLAIALRTATRDVGLLALYRRADEPDFSAGAEEAVRTLAGQASIAVDNVMLHQEAERLSITDALTGVWNFRYLSMSLAREIERASRFNRPLAVLMLDLDRFKLVNDTHGHARGDAVLRETAARISEQVREVDTLARYGGEEFVLVLPETTVEGATMLAERICVAVRREPFGEAPREEPLTVTVSVGVAAFPAHGASPATLMRAADEALYVAKRSGRDRWTLARSAGAPVGDLVEDLG